TNAGSVSFTVTFSQPVTGVSTANFVTVEGTGLSGSSVTGVTPISSTTTTTWTGTANTGSGTGTLALRMQDSPKVHDSVSNAVGSVPFTGTPAYNIDKTAPAVNTINLNGATPTNQASVSWVVTFSKPVTGVGVSNFQTVEGSGISGTQVIGVTPA